MLSLSRSSANRLTESLIPRFLGDTLFDKIARTVCRAGCLPRKELFETWEAARRIRRRFRGGRVVDFACGHGLLGSILLLLDDSSPEVLAIDRRIPDSAQKVFNCLQAEWPRLRGRVELLEGALQEIELDQEDLVVSIHACGGLTDLILDRAAAARCRVAVLPCCHDLESADLGGLQGWLEGPVAVDVTRVARLRDQGYHVVTQQIPADITPQNRLLLGTPC